MQRVTSPHTDSLCLCDRVFVPVHQMLKRNSFQRVKLLMHSLLGSTGTSMVIYQSVSQQKERNHFHTLWHTDFPGQFMYTQPQICRTLVAGGI